MFTGNKETDKIVLSNLDDYDLGKVCSANKHLSEICKDESFWRNRTLTRFGSYLGDVDKIKEYMKKYNLSSWKKYYIYLVDFIERIYDGTMLFVPTRKDLQILFSVIEKNNTDMENNIVHFVQRHLENGTWNDDFHLLQPFLENELQKDLINPNILFYPEELDNDRIGDQIKFLLSSKDKRIRLNYSNYNWFISFATNHDYAYDDAKEIFKLIINDKRIDPNLLFQYQPGYIVKEYLPILAQSNRIKKEYYPDMLKLLFRSENEEDKEETFKQYATRKLTFALNKLK